jgi:cytochrome c oxidase assembly protein subunit 15
MVVHLSRREVVKTLRLMRIFAILTSVGAYCMLLMGSIVSKTGSGEGCGNSWPFCHGQLIPDSLPVETVFEYSHRIISGIDGFLILLLTAWTWLVFKRNFRAKLLSFLSLFFVIVQGGLGALTVAFSATFAKKALLALHFGFSLISFASVIMLTIYLFQLRSDETEGSQRHESTSLNLRNLSFAIWGLATYTYAVVYTGALVRHSSAIMGCGYEIFGCGSTSIPNLTSIAGIQLLHRYAAVSLWFLVLAFLVVVLRSYRSRLDLLYASILAFILLTLQAASGVANVLTGGQLMAALVHTTIISVFFTVVCYLCMQLGWPWQKRVQGQIRVAAPEEVLTKA